jgi:hypothetical protein
MAEERLTQLVYELLDAHADTANLAAELAGDVRWDAHLDYLRALQRCGRALMAEADRSQGHDLQDNADRRWTLFV